ncbi:MAG TPA: hypothetical protein VFT74_11290 [Isosphaeraceae bacterium]|nr:hypothetical protein [Isosphaeraceae bacterium]
MSRFIGCLALALLAAAPAAAGELDKEFGPKAPNSPAVAKDDLQTTLPATSSTADRTASELDAETPTQACGWRRGFGFGGFGGFGLGYGRLGYGGLGYGGFGYGGLGYGGLGYGGFGYGGLGGFGLGYGGLGYGLGGFYGGYRTCGYGGWGYW